MYRVFIKPKPCSIMSTLKDSESRMHLSKLAKETDTTYVYVTKLVSQLEKQGFLRIEPLGKKRIVSLTDKGLAVANAIEELCSKFEEQQ
jgi:predicted transcriptional regulator